MKNLTLNGKTISVASIEGVNETLFYPLVAKYLETNKKDGILYDPKSVEIITSLNYDITKAKVSMTAGLGICLRTIIIDSIVKKFIETHPDGTIVNLGCGLDTRFSRLDNEKIHWFDLDLPDTISLRRRFFTETERNCFIAKSVLDFSWVEDIRPGNSTLFIAEGLSYYFTESENKALVSTIKQNYPGAEYAFDALHPFFLKLYKKRKSDDYLSNKLAALLKWGVKSGRELESWCDGVHFVEEWSEVNAGKDRFSISKKIILLRLT
jgi:O-methyltransferase involved in polyketide biosynthesis